MNIADNLKSLNKRISVAAQKVGRSPQDIKLVVVTKNVDVERIKEVVSLGVKEIGENRVQEALKKIEILNTDFKDINWHMVGHLQTNKAKKAVENFKLIQSLDSLHLAFEINKYAQKQNKLQDCLIEVKVSQEPTKFGVMPDEVGKLMDEVSRLENIRVLGLMTLAPYFDEPEKTRPYFEKARKLFEIHFNFFKNYTETPILSMGMSNDFEVAIEEGSNMIRIGTAIFGARC